MTQEKKYLTEKSLGDALKLIFPDHEFIHNKTVPKSGMKTRPDYRNDDLMLIVEFDGNRHYQQSAVQMRDGRKQTVYEMMGYKIVSIPYFVQLSTETIKLYFGVDMEWEQTYPHGFIDEKCHLPSDFNSLGMRLFSKNLNDLSANLGTQKVVSDIIESLNDKAKQFINGGDFEHESVLKVSSVTNTGWLMDWVVDMADYLVDDDIQHLQKLNG